MEEMYASADYPAHLPCVEQIPQLDADPLRLTETEARMFAETNREYYARKWFRQGQAKPGGFNWGALLYPDAWMAYRKMYRELTVYFLLRTVFEFVVFIFAVMARAPGTAVRIALLAATLAACLVLGFLANRLYWKKALRAKRKALRQAPQQQTAVFRKQGGSSVVSMFLVPSLILFVIYVVFTVVTVGFVWTAMRFW